MSLNYITGCYKSEFLAETPSKSDLERMNGKTVVVVWRESPFLGEITSDKKKLYGKSMCMGKECVYVEGFVVINRQYM